jgi:hypothetical protein
MSEFDIEQYNDPNNPKAPVIRHYGYGIMGKTKAYVSECCVAEIPEALEEELEYARDTDPDEDFRIVQLFGILNLDELKLNREIIQPIKINGV